MSDLTGNYGDAPESLWELDLSDSWTEFMHYMYLPVRIPMFDMNYVPDPDVPRGAVGVRLPKRLEFLREAVMSAIYDSERVAPHLWDGYVYVTARRGFATPGNPLNRPGWHCDDFGGTDLNYVWTDNFPTQFLLSEEPLNISPDDAESMSEMAEIAKRVSDLAQGSAEHEQIYKIFKKQMDAFQDQVGLSSWDGIRIENGPLNVMQRLTPWVIHNAPEISSPGGLRSFFKISVSTHRYDLVGNSHNHLLNYDWPMHSREALRNQPSGNSDYAAGRK